METHEKTAMGNFEWCKIKKIIASASTNAKLQMTLLDSFSILDSMCISDHRTSHHTKKSLDSGTLLGAHRTAESSTPIDKPQAHLFQTLTKKLVK